MKKFLFIPTLLLFACCNSPESESDTYPSGTTGFPIPVSQAIKEPVPASAPSSPGTYNHAPNADLYNGTAGNTEDAYNKIHYAFEGMPDENDVKRLLEYVMSRDKMVINNESVLRCANVLVALRKDSRVGVTEMEILKHMYQNGSSGIDYATQAAISATYLEQTK